MAEYCSVSNLQCVARSMDQLCDFRNPSGVLVRNPLGSNRWSRLVSGKNISLRALEFSPGLRLRCVASSSPPPKEQPIQLSVETEEFPPSIAGAGNAKSVWVSAMEFASSLVSNPSEQQAKKKRNRMGERKVYLLAAILSSIGFVTMAGGAVYYRFYWQMQGSAVPHAEILGTFALAIGAAVGIGVLGAVGSQGPLARFALEHARALLRALQSHHKPREGPFEMNDVFAIINAVPAISLMAYGFFNSGLVPGLCFGAGLGITMFGMAYMFVHDGLVHRRFPVGPIADVPYLQKVAAAHQLHHADLFGGVPYGLFLGPQELANVGGEAELQKVLNSKYKSRKE